jgi:broad specificity phosphatase PhoE
MTEICIIRHGETDWNAQFRIQGRTDIPLNETGRRQASVTAEYLKDESWDVIYSSPLVRALETARTISKAVGVSSIRTEPDLVEREFGPADGMMIEERRKVYPDWTNIAGAENLDDVRIRAVDALTKISERHNGKRIIVVSHACFIMETLASFSRDSIDGRKTKLKNLSMTMLTRDSEWKIPWYNRSAMDLEPT